MELWSLLDLWKHLTPLRPAPPKERDNLGELNLRELITRWLVCVPDEIVSPCTYQSS